MTTRQVRLPGRVPPWVVAVVVVLVLSLVLWWRVVAAGPSTSSICGCGDPAFTLWYLGYPAHVLSHGGGLWWTSLLWHPTGVDVLDAASSLGLGIPLAWLSLLAGPVAALNAALIAASAMSAMSMWLLLRRWGSSASSALVAGVLFGFSPTVVMNLAEAHLVVGFLAPLPLLVLAIDEVLTGRRSRELLAGVAAAGLVVLEFLISPEVLVMAGLALGLAAAGGLLGCVVRGVPVQFTSPTRRGLGLAVVLSIIALAWPGYVALQGRAHVAGSVYPSASLWQAGTTVRHLVLPSPASSALMAFTARFGGFQGPQLSADYIGIGVLVVAGLSVLLLRRHLLAWLLASVAVVFVVLSLGSPGAGWRPWELFGRLPILENLIPSRLLVVVWFCLAALIGLGLDAAAQQWRRWFVRPGLMVVALAPTIAYLAPAMPLAAETVAAPRVFEHQAGQVVLPIPAGFSAIQSSLAWQSVTGYSWSMAGGDGPGSDPRFHARDRLAIHALQRVSGSFPSSPLIATSPLSVRASLERWGVTRIVMASGPGLPAYDLPIDPLGAAALVTAATGEAPVRAQQGWVWSFDARHAPSPRRLDVHRCTVEATRGVQAVAACVLAMGSGVERR